MIKWSTQTHVQCLTALNCLDLVDIKIAVSLHCSGPSGRRVCWRCLWLVCVRVRQVVLQVQLIQLPPALCFVYPELRWYSFRSNRALRFAGDWHTSAGVRAGYVCFSFKAALKRFHLVPRKRESCLRFDVLAFSRSSCGLGETVYDENILPSPDSRTGGCYVVRQQFLLIVLTWTVSNMDKLFPKKHVVLSGGFTRSSSLILTQFVLICWCNLTIN